MSRTYKDVPIKVKLLRAYKEGNIEHDHNVRMGRIRKFVGIEKVFIPKSNAAEVYKFRNELIAAGEVFTEENIPAYRVFKRLGGRLSSVEINPKLVLFIIEKVSTYRLASAYCTDYEHYDHERGVDTRDGLRPACHAVLGKGKRRSCGCCVSKKVKFSKIGRKAKMNNIARAFNSGTKMEELDDYYDESIHYENAGSIWD